MLTGPWIQVNPQHHDDVDDPGDCYIRCCCCRMMMRMMAMNFAAGSVLDAAAPAFLLLKMMMSWMWVSWIEVIDLMRKRMKRENKDSGVKMRMLMMMELALLVGGSS